MEISKIIAIVAVLLFNSAHSTETDSSSSIGNTDLDYVWTNYHPILTKYITLNREKIYRDGKYLFKNSHKYIPHIEKIATKHNVPKEIAVVAAIESAFNPTAQSSAGAKGMWQFMEATAKDMGLSSEDRTDWKKSTRAAILYLKWLSFNKFNGDYELALLAYNGGIGRVKRAMERHNTNDPWELIRLNALPKETQEYLPKFITYVYYYGLRDEL
jgi:membrane-bound lytic murein transglycosylase D